MSLTVLMRIIGDMEPCQYQNTDLVMGLLLELHELRAALQKTTGQSSVVDKISDVIANLETVDAHNSRLEHSLLEYRAFKRQSAVSLAAAPNL